MIPLKYVEQHLTAELHATIMDSNHSSIFLSQRFTGSTDRHTTVTNLFNEGIICYIRIIPTGYQDDHPSMRVELLGCNGKVIL